MDELAFSILPSDFAYLANEIAGAERLPHDRSFDAMDRHFVPNITLGPPMVKAMDERKAGRRASGGSIRGADAGGNIYKQTQRRSLRHFALCWGCKRRFLAEMTNKLAATDYMVTDESTVQSSQ